jgi:hypothetical protein
VYSEDGFWDPDLWISSFAASSGESGSQTTQPREKRKTVTDGEALSRKRPIGEFATELQIAIDNLTLTRGLAENCMSSNNIYCATFCPSVVKGGLLMNGFRDEIAGKLS